MTPSKEPYVDWVVGSYCLLSLNFRGKFPPEIWEFLISSRDQKVRTRYVLKSYTGVGDMELYLLLPSVPTFGPTHPTPPTSDTPQKDSDRTSEKEVYLDLWTRDSTGSRDSSLDSRFV